MANFPLLFDTGSGSPANAEAIAKKNLSRVWWAVAGAAGFGIALVLAYSWRAVPVTLMWAGGSFVTGALVGFLFGIPRVLQGDAVVDTSAKPAPKDGSASPPDGYAWSAPPPKYRQLVNTSLEQISEWLTKMIIGIGISQLNPIWNNLIGTSNFISRQISPKHNDAEAPFAMGMLIYFGITGFLAGYLLTRMFLAPAFGRVDSQS